MSKLRTTTYIFYIVCLLTNIELLADQDNCCRLRHGGCIPIGNKTECNSIPGTFFEYSQCCSEGDYMGQCRPAVSRKDCYRRVSLATVTDFMVIPIPVGFKLQWKTKAELDNAGFFVWRGIKEENEYKDVHRVSELIPAKGNLTNEATYFYENIISNSQKKTVYCYGLEDVDTHGISTYHYDFIKCFPQ
ncbi:MAG: hypothetical protein HC877_15945 [Thioploca sp.]|nr:hypothetical protein [Thioploca sp.]